MDEFLDLLRELIRSNPTPLLILSVLAYPTLFFGIPYVKNNLYYN